MSQNYETVIGLETHVQLSTKSKAFCGDRNAFGGDPNRHLSVISLGYPGTLPRLNETQLYYAVKLGLALGCTINPQASFDRKNYFYADLPKGYQITQDHAPICLGGTLPIRLKDGTQKEVRIHHIHMEEDAGKSIHSAEKPYSFVDLNRAGTPLVEIVTEPDLRSPEEVDAFMSGIRQLVRYLDISDGNMQEGSLRCDVNISIRPFGQEAYGQRCEVKNLNSMRYARKAIEYEVARQINLVTTGESVRQQTRQFDPKTGTTRPLRDKEDAHDYRYFPEPDLPPLQLSESYIAEIQSSLPTLPWAAFQHLRQQYALSAYDADLISAELGLYQTFCQYAEAGAPSEPLAKLFINRIVPYLNEKGLGVADFPLSPQTVKGYLSLIAEGTISSSTAAAKLFPALLDNPEQSPASLAEELGIVQNTDTDFLTGLVDRVLEEFPDKVATFRKGKKGLLGFFMGEVMKRSKGQAEPKETQALLLKKLNEN